MSAAVRTVRDEEIIFLDYHKVGIPFKNNNKRRSSNNNTPNPNAFSAPIPERLLEFEPHRDRLFVFWKEHFSAAVTQLCLARQQKKFLVHTNAKRSIFQAGMERVCEEISNMTENIKVHFIVTPIVKKGKEGEKNTQQQSSRKKKKPPKLMYHIRIALLSDIPKEVKADQVKQRYNAEITSEQDLAQLAKEEFDKKPLSAKPLTIMAQIVEGDEEDTSASEFGDGDYEDDYYYDDDDDDDEEDDGELAENSIWHLKTNAIQQSLSGDDAHSLIMTLSERSRDADPGELYHIVQNSVRPH